MSDNVLIAPSILSADFGHLARDLDAVSGADYIHVDVMDGHFTPNLTFGVEIVRAVKRLTDVPLDVHMMVSNPEESVDWYADAGADMITVHVEASTHLHRTVAKLKARGVKAGVVLNPGTSVSVLDAIIDEVDVVLLMSVDPGFGGQSYIASTDRKITELVDLCRRRGASPIIEIDGGVSKDNIARLAEAGVDMFVAGSAVYKSDDPARAVEELRAAGDLGLARRGSM